MHTCMYQDTSDRHTTATRTDAHITVMCVCVPLVLAFPLVDSNTILEEKQTPVYHINVTVYSSMYIHIPRQADYHFSSPMPYMYMYLCRA